MSVPLKRKRKRSEPKLTHRQALFVIEYLKDLSQTEAAIRAGYATKYAGKTGHALMQMPHVLAEIQKHMDQRSERVQVDADWVLQRLADIADADVRKLFEAPGKLIRPDQIDDKTARAIASMEFTTVEIGGGAVEHVAKIKTVDRLRALELLGKHLKLFTDRLEIDVSDRLAERLERARRRVPSRVVAEQRALPAEVVPVEAEA